MNTHRTGIVATCAKSKALSHMTGCPMAQSLVDVAGAFPKPLTGALNLPAGTTFAMAKHGAYLCVHDCGHDIMMELPLWTAHLVLAAVDEFRRER